MALLRFVAAHKECLGVEIVEILGTMILVALMGHFGKLPFSVVGFAVL
jgi:hypothetical protein